MPNGKYDVIDCQQKYEVEEFNPHSPDYKLSKDHLICDECKLVKPNSDFDDSELIAKLADMRTKTATGQIGITMAQTLIDMIRKDDKG